ncbi:gamma-glutamyl-gamma-aminobutyrate hydrolase family protein [Thermococcus thioreducens]|uniref:Gamma-glutamyl-gamma-aminobutyrate hydrolase n=1 Tax=Thermococcus thioreducens TaxID=277988 RepID=A0A0Q2XKL0_9EURY|nr:gamma-glutamyl-gamma-aminobutyrate hydrolase family protein [Thermococcus thioreducens]ASJ13128.1 gamma-glutamyl-gamma-aminobutyrate hydrolase [Thermococcus thioreducens]KQH81636.1 glutamine amidotransferase [Thermococcus thioreducens]SEV80724.1 putative glutamine amidotransferase [Thermococcus thioreducens]
MKPLIGIIGQTDPSKNRLFLDRRHIERIAEAGGVPAVFNINCSPDEILEHVDGILLIEGPDVHPYFYGEDPSSAIKYVDVERDEFEICLVKKAVERGVPILGISRGMHVINVALGGTLYQDLTDIPKAIKHDWDVNLIGPSQRVHGVRIKTNSRLYEILKDGLDIEGTNEVYLRVNSFHHQAVKRVGEGIKPVAYAVDGLIEAIEGAEGFIIGLQWQPEYLPEMVRVFEAFVRAAAEYRLKKLELEKIEIEAELREELTKGQGGSHHSSETNGSPPDTNQT